MPLPVGNRCEIFNCTELAQIKGLCGKHYKRVQRHSDPEFNSRPKVGGFKRNKDHPLYTLWRTITRRNLGKDVCEEWKDFRKFVEDVGEKPTESASLRRRDRTKSYSLENAHWVIPSLNRELQNLRLKDRIKLKKLEDPHYSKKAQLKKNYNLTWERYQEMLIQQGGVCKVCGQPETKKPHGLSVDHCHVTNQVRGLLCSNCNSVLGYAKDSLEILMKCIAYLENSVKIPPEVPPKT